MNTEKQIRVRVMREIASKMFWEKILIKTIKRITSLKANQIRRQSLHTNFNDIKGKARKNKLTEEVKRIIELKARNKITLHCASTKKLFTFYVRKEKA